MSRDTKIKKTIILIGMMGAGKTSIGRELAKKLDLPFIDSDERIEEKVGCSISWIFDIKGEDGFRKIEKEVIAEIINQNERCVLSIGGGAFINSETRKLIKEKSLSIWLKSSLDLIFERVSRSTTRPLLEKGNKKEILKKLINERYPIYAQADITIENEGKSKNAIIREIINLLQSRSYF